MSTYMMDSPYFKIKLHFNIFEADILCPSNTIMSVFIDSDGFCASCDMDIDIKEFVDFVDKLAELLTVLNGNAKIQEPFGNRQYIEFSGDGKGHIRIQGYLDSSGRNGFFQTLEFENQLDQTYFSEFVTGLSALCDKYRQ